MPGGISGIRSIPLVIAIEQDFYATMYLTNMVSLAKQDANEKIAEHYKERNLKIEI